MSTGRNKIPLCFIMRVTLNVTFKITFLILHLSRKVNCKSATGGRKTPLVHMWSQFLIFFVWCTTVPVNRHCSNYLLSWCPGSRWLWGLRGWVWLLVWGRGLGCGGRDGGHRITQTLDLQLVSHVQERVERLLVNLHLKKSPRKLLHFPKLVPPYYSLCSALYHVRP